MTLNRCFFDFHVWSDKTLCSDFESRALALEHGPHTGENKTDSWAADKLSVRPVSM